MTLLSITHCSAQRHRQVVSSEGIRCGFDVASSNCGRHSRETARMAGMDGFRKKSLPTGEKKFPLCLGTLSPLRQSHPATHERNACQEVAQDSTLRCTFGRGKASVRVQSVSRSRRNVLPRSLAKLCCLLSKAAHRKGGVGVTFTNATSSPMRLSREERWSTQNCKRFQSRNRVPSVRPRRDTFFKSC